MQGTSTTSLSQETRDLELNLMSKYPQLSSPDAARQMLVSKCVARATAAVQIRMAAEMAVERLIIEVEGSPTCDDKEGKDNDVVVSTSSSGVATSSASSASGGLGSAADAAKSYTFHSSFPGHEGQQRDVSVYMTSSMSSSNDNHLTSILHHHHHTTFAGSPTLVMLNAAVNDTIIEGIQVVVSLATDSPLSMVINTQTLLGSSTLIESKNLPPQRYVGAFLLHAVDDEAFDRLEALIPPHILKCTERDEWCICAALPTWEAPLTLQVSPYT